MGWWLHLLIQPMAQGLLEGRGEEVVAKDADAGGGCRVEPGELCGELPGRGVGQVQAGSQSDAPLGLRCGLCRAVCGPLRGFVVEGVVDHG